MRLILTTTLAGVAMIAGSTGAFAADDVVVSGSRVSPPTSLDQKATAACLNAFIAELLPGNTAQVRTVIPADGVSIFTNHEDSVVSPYKIMMIEVTAKALNGGELLAQSTCAVNRHAVVLRLSMHATAAAKRAGLTLKDIKLAMTNR